jgi:hypothetical protein
MLIQHFLLIHYNSLVFLHLTSIVCFLATNETAENVIVVSIKYFLLVQMTLNSFLLLLNTNANKLNTVKSDNLI